MVLEYMESKRPRLRPKHSSAQPGAAALHNFGIYGFSSTFLQTPVFDHFVFGTPGLSQRKLSIAEVSACSAGGDG